MWSFLYNLLIFPIETVIEITFSIMWAICKNYGLSIIAVSLVIQTLVLPLYKRSDEIQDQERQRQNAMAHWVLHIKKKFSGEERFMMLSAYYKEQNYKSWYALRSSLSILLQIPFFIAAYNYLSNLTILQNKHFGLIMDLGQPDSIFEIGGLTINVMPILMTLINIISGRIYTKQLRIKDKIQVYGLAAVFLVLLYNSPSGLVLYWTMNNVYSLCKNIIMERRKNKHASDEKIGDNAFEAYPDTGKLFTAVSCFMTLFMGGIVTLNVVGSSPTEFVGEGYSPMTLTVANLTLYAGVFLIWFRIFFQLMNRKWKFRFTAFLTIVSVIGFLNYMIWGNSFGRMTPLLEYEAGMGYAAKDIAVNLLVLIPIAVAVYFLTRKHSSKLARVFGVVAVSALCFCIYRGACVQREMTEYYESNADGAVQDKIFNLSKKGKNVVVIMLDRAIDGYVPFIMNEKPQLLDSFDGFTWYPNTISFGNATNFASPAVYGGYEYIPTAMNARPNEKLADKHNEALLMLPRIFADADYSVTVCDPPYAGYKWDPDLSIYDDYDDINAYKLQGAYTDRFFSQFSSAYLQGQQRAFAYFSLMRINPIGIQPFIYRDGGYFGQVKSPIRRSFLDCYSALLNLGNITNVSEDDSNNFIQIQNSITHELAVLSEPDFVPTDELSDGRNFSDTDRYNGSDRIVNGKRMRMETRYQAAHYQDNVAAYLLLARWFDYLKENDCWDNTRIIIVSDHGGEIGQFDEMILDNGIDVQKYNPLLLVKDFDSTGFAESEEFMTNADVPALSVDSLIENPVNPFTGNVIDKDNKNIPLMVTTSTNYAVGDNNGCIFDTSDSPWYEIIPGDIFDGNNWKMMY